MGGQEYNVWHRLAFCQYNFRGLGGTLLKELWDPLALLPSTTERTLLSVNSRKEQMPTGLMPQSKATSILTVVAANKCLLPQTCMGVLPTAAISKKMSDRGDLRL